MDKNGNKKPWENSFSDDNAQEEGYLSRIALRKQKENFKLILSVLVSIVALTAIFSLVFGMSKQNDVQQYQSISKKKTKKVTKPQKNNESKHDTEQNTSQNTSQNTNETQTTSNDQESSGEQNPNDTNHDTSQDNAEYVTVNQSEGIYRLATNAGISVSQLQALNGLNKNSVITPGQKLRIK
ncbi:LysM peptidoglycan-binding domain-containing protein [Fructilactobacillus sanfranciscensis]|uniref:LysM peptidoglycan-binding domain-containing protein n=1 Tax=Fructilactobacillus sanfranciscensis TaxID=1625 RepID=UPI0013D24FC0|nr:LysM domain-containing protein [Fructilactobacillus sanfranciscensis]NDR76968.1 LysM domain-containing protein [Fructilactobacillus sanfranciscensis]